MKIFFGSQAVQQAVADSEIAVCLSEDVRESLQEASMLVSDAADTSATGGNTVNRVLNTISTFIADSTDVYMRAMIQYAYHHLDILLAYIIGVLKGVMDVAQTADWEDCKLPVVETGMQGLGRCACGDQAYRISAPVKQQAWDDGAFWCSGLLMLNEGDGSDHIVWNPYSLHELFALSTTETTDLNLYLACLQNRWQSPVDVTSSYTVDYEASRDWQDLLYYKHNIRKESIEDFKKMLGFNAVKRKISCDSYKPKLAVFEAQGVDVLQVINRCRANYQQKKWDEASTLYSLFELSDWAVVQYPWAPAMPDDNKLPLRLKVRERINLAMSTLNLAESAYSRSGKSLGLTGDSWQCLHNALYTGFLHHACYNEQTDLRLAFEYEPAPLPMREEEIMPFASYEDTDACRVFSSPWLNETSSNGINLKFPRFLWAGSSSNKAPLAMMHTVDATEEQRLQDASVKLQKLLDEEIRPTFEQLTDQLLRDHLSEHVDVSAFSVEGDELHQLVDCIVLGPYAAADLHAMPKNHDGSKSLPRRQYHRGLSTSRDFVAWGATGGSDSRQSVIKAVLNEVNEQAVDVIVQTAVDRYKDLRSKWLDMENMLCQCAGSSVPSLECCVQAESLGDLNFGLRYSFDIHDWDISADTLNQTWNFVSQSDTIANTLWASHDVLTPLQLHEEDRQILAQEHVFESRPHQPVFTYAVDDTPDVVHNTTLWHSCMDKVMSLYALIPFTTASENINANRDSSDSKIKVPVPHFTYDAAEDYSSDQVHVMESVVDKIVQVAFEHSPVFWTKAHRYVASDSIWCESESTSLHVSTPADDLNTDEFWFGNPMQTDAVDGPRILNIADVLNACACGWSHNNLCAVPATVCEQVATISNPTDLQTVMQNNICLASRNEDGLYTYATRSELLAVLDFLQVSVQTSSAQSWQHICQANTANAHWGLLHETDSWYMGMTQAEALGWHLDLQTLATVGPNGLRLSLLSANSSITLSEYLSQFDLGGDRKHTYNAHHGHTIAQPVCKSTLHTVLRDDLDAYFKDVFVPMAHSVQISPPVEYCSRWLIEHAMARTLETFQNDANVSDIFFVNLREHQAAATKWRDLCLNQMHETGLCVLRGIYDLIPDFALQVPEHCTTVVSSDFANRYKCEKFYYTESCLVYCDGQFHDPTLSDTAVRTGLNIFNLLDLTLHEPLLTSSMHWPASIESKEASTDENLIAARAQLAQLASSTQHEDTNLTDLFGALQTMFFDTHSEDETIANEYCDDLYDYWPDTQHPIGYHPTVTCDVQNSSIRGFGAWMSQNADGEVVLDPIRMRNMTQVSTFFGTGHLTCDAHAYAAPGHALNSLYMASRWKADATADAAMPKQAPAVTLPEMNFYGTPTYDSMDSTRRASGHASEQLLEHSIGLVRDWAKWHIIDYANAAERTSASANQNTLNMVWPHWHKTSSEYIYEQSSAGLFLSQNPDPPANCMLPVQERCRVNTDCNIDSFLPDSEDMVCLLNYEEDAAIRRGVCMLKDTCYQHAHCAADLMCSGEGRCVQPQIFIRNDARFTASVQLYSDSPTCEMDTKYMSMFGHVDSFLQHNGMCSFRNWYEYQNISSSALNHNADDDTVTIPNRLHMPTDSVNSQELLELGRMFPNPHACDRSYEHSTYQNCAQDVRLGPKSSPNIRLFNATRTWQEQNGEALMHMCNMPRDEIVGFLHPYQASQQNLLQATQQIRRCEEFKLCPQMNFHVRGRSVARRRVHSVLVNENDQVVKDAMVRDYCSLDAQRCFAIGSLVCENVQTPLACVCSQTATSKLCALDHLVMPVLQVLRVYENGIDTGNFRDLADIRNFCPHAFENPLDKWGQGETLYAHFKNKLFRPQGGTVWYDYTNTELRDELLYLSNAIFFALYGITDDVSSRGFSTLNAYLEHANCTAHIAQRMNLNEQMFAQAQQNNPYLQYYSADEFAGVHPGGSIYLFVQRQPVFVPLRWLVQCVVLASSDEGGVYDNWVRHLFTGKLNTEETVACSNYIHQAGTGEITLKHRLQTARFLFTQKEGAEDFAHIEFVTDLQNIISTAINELSGRSIPEISCIESAHHALSPENLTENSANQDAGTCRDPISEGSDTFIRHRRRDLSFDSIGVETSENMDNIFLHVLRYLFANSDYENRDQMTFETLSQITIEDMIEKQVLLERALGFQLSHEILENRDRYALYQFNQTKSMVTVADNLLLPCQVLTASYFDTSDDVTVKKQTMCCDPGLAPDGCNLDLWAVLSAPEYLIPQLRCDSESPTVAGLGWLPCSEEVMKISRHPVVAVDQYHQTRTQVIRANEYMYLIFVFMEHALSSSLLNGLGALHPRRFEADCSRSEIDPSKVCVSAYAQYYADEFDTDPEVLDVLSLHTAVQFNNFMQLRTEASIDCGAGDVNFQAETNTQQAVLRQCLEDLQAHVGWLVPPNEFVQLHVSSSVLMEGFYPTFTEYVTSDYNFLRNLTSNKWTQPQHAPMNMHICYVNSELLGSESPPQLMSPFLAELYDVANEHDSEDYPSMACDMKGSDADDELFTYYTKCHVSDPTCAMHPAYKEIVSTKLPDACTRLHGTSIHRSQIGNVLGKPLCRQSADTPTSNCPRKHGTIGAHKGRMSNLRNKEPVLHVQAGLWNSSNYLFRSDGEAHVRADDLVSMRVKETDIAGHCLEFVVTDSNRLVLDRIYLSSDCLRMPQAQVRNWFVDVENDYWAWQTQFKAMALAMPADDTTPQVSWRCPLHWFQMYHDDNSAYQARTPAPFRNMARFHHITMQSEDDKRHAFAHPTVFESAKVRNVQAAKYLHEGLACIGKEHECHAQEFLFKTIDTLLQQQDEWKVLEYVPAQPEGQCTRVLDWPEEERPRVQF